VEATVMPQQEIDAFVRNEYEKWGKVVKATGAKVN
jgi:hypothetical protein